MRALMRLYPDSPIVPCNYNDCTRTIEPYGFRLMRPFQPHIRMDSSWDIILASGLNHFLQTPDYILYTVFHSTVNLYVSNRGIVSSIPLFESSDSGIQRYVNVFIDAEYYPGEKYIVVGLVPTYQPINFLPLTPAKLIYFPNRNLLYDGHKHYERTTESIEPLSITNLRQQYAMLLSKE